MTAKWTGLMLKTKNQSNVSLTSYCKNLHLFILFCIDWMLENLKICPYSQAQKGFKKKEKKRQQKILNGSLHVLACISRPQRWATQSDLNLFSQAASLQPAGLASASWLHLPDFLVIIWESQWPFFYDFLFPFFLFFMHAALDGLRAQWQKAVAVGWPGTHREQGGDS